MEPDGLFSWRWTPRGGGQVLDPNSATDADEDIAFALLVASTRFSRPEYVQRARLLLHAIRTHEGVDVAGGWFPAAGNWAPPPNASSRCRTFHPMHIRISIAWILTAAGWRWYASDTTCCTSRWARHGTRLPPDFLTVGPDGTLGPLPEASTLGRSLSFDGIRIPWRVALDCELHGRAEACVAGGAVPALLGALRSSGRLVSAYDSSGAPITADQSLSVYACLLPVLVADDPVLARDVRRTHLSFDTLMTIVGDQNRYNDLNWTWFGIASASGLTAKHTPPVSAF